MKNSNPLRDENFAGVDVHAKGAPDPAAPAPPAAGPLDEKVEAWFAKHFHGLGPLLDERLYNHVHAAKEDLKAELRSS